MPLKDGGKTVAELEQEWLDGMTLSFGCAFCTWSFSGSFAEGRAASETHRTDEHPEIPPYKRRRRGGITRPRWRSRISDDEREEVDEERRRRALETGVEIDIE